MRRTYFGAPHGQLHAYLWHADNEKNPLLCLPPAPHTGIYFKTLAKHLDWPIIAVDYPGTGGSDRLKGKPKIEDYAAALKSIIEASGPVHLLGFHSGCLVALEMAQKLGDQIAELILIDGPFFDAAKRETYKAGFPDITLIEDLNDLEAGFDTNVYKRRDQIGGARAQEIWIETLRAGTGYNDLFQAAFAYDVETALSRCHRHVHVLATQSSLRQVTRDAADVLAHAAYTEIDSITANVFETGAPIIAPIIKSILA